MSAKTSDRKKASSPKRNEAQKRKSEAIVEQIASAVGRLTLGEGGSVSPDLGLGLLDVYGKLTGDSLLSAFARGALERRTEREREAEAQKGAPRSPQAPKPPQRSPKSDPAGYAAALGKTYSLDDFRAKRSESAETEKQKKSEPNHREVER